MQIQVHGVTLTYDPETLLFSVETPSGTWKTVNPPCVQLAEYAPRKSDWFLNGGPVEYVPLTRAGKIETTPWKTGLGEGFMTRFEEIPGTGLTFETVLWVDYARGELFAEVIPYDDPEDGFYAVQFPAPFENNEMRDDACIVVPAEQGFLIRNTGDYDDTCNMHGTRGDYQPNNEGAFVPPIYAWKRFYEYNDSSMPWFGQTKGDSSFIAISEVPWDGGYYLTGRPGTPKEISPLHYPSLGKMRDRRVTRYAFFTGDYNDMAKIYRQYAEDIGRAITLKAKAARCPNVERLIGCAIVHEGSYWHCQPDSRYYIPDHPEENDKVLGTFYDRARQLTALKEKWGLDKVYLHLDGWGVDGYDTHHPDTIPPNDKCGGWEGMAYLSDTCEKLGYVFATHDQYRDYYANAESFRVEDCCTDHHGYRFEHAVWPGGRQGLLCASQAPMYVRRNFEALKEHGINLSGSYLDVFCACELDQCANPRHRMTRKECMEYRLQCFDYIMDRGIASSSEIVMDWAMRTSCYCHHCPWIGYPAALPKGTEYLPLVNLVYHDCMLQPAEIEGRNADPAKGHPKKLTALLMGNAAYLPIEPTEQEVNDYKEVAAFQERVQHKQMLRWDVLSENVVRAEYEGGISVTVDFGKDTYVIEG